MYIIILVSGVHLNVYTLNVISHLNTLWNEGHVSLRAIIPIMHTFMTQDIEITRKICKTGMYRKLSQDEIFSEYNRSKMWIGT